MVITCPRCQAENRESSAFCRACGASMRDPGRAAPPSGRSRAPAEGRKARRFPWKVFVALVVICSLGLVGWHYRETLADAAAAVTGQEQAEARLLEVETLSAAKDSLFDEVMETTSLIAEISTAVSAIQLGRPGLAFANDEAGPPATIAAARRLILARIDSLKQRLANSETRMGESLERMRQYAGAQERLQAQLAEYERRINTMTELIGRQQTQLATLETDATILRAENQRLSAERDELAAAQSGLEEQITDLSERQNTVYWIAGRKDDLKRRGVIVETGGNFLGGRTLVPAQPLPVEEFIALNLAQETVLTLPNAGKRYKIVSPHNGAMLNPIADKDRKVRGTFTITDPDAFWSASRYLILVED